MSFGWAFSLPDGWRAGRLDQGATVRTSNVDKHSVDGQLAVRLCNYTDVYKNDAIVEGMDFMRATATLEQLDRFRLAAGDTIITKDSETANDIGIPSFVRYEARDLVCGYHLAIIRPDKAVEARYLYWAMVSQPTLSQWAVLASGVTRVGIRSTDLAKVSIEVPPYDMQWGIADYLDRETAQIDELIAEQQRLIGLLRERRSAAVASSLADAEGSLTKLKYVAVVQSGVTLSGDGDPDDPEWPYLRVANVQGGFVSLDEVKTMRLSRESAVPAMLRDGDVLMTEGGDIDKLGRGALWTGEVANMLHQNHIFAVRPVEGRLDPRFLVLWLDGPVARRYFRATARKTTNLAGTNKWILGNLPVVCPSLPEQRRILEESGEQILKINQLIAETERCIALSRERRAALITAAVTGQLDVTSASRTP